MSRARRGGLYLGLGVRPHVHPYAHHAPHLTFTPVVLPPLPPHPCHHLEPAVPSGSCGLACHQHVTLVPCAWLMARPMVPRVLDDDMLLRV